MERNVQFLRIFLELLMELEYIKQNYERMSDEELRFKLVHSFKELRPEVVDIVIAECEKRGFSAPKIKQLKNEAQVYDEGYLQNHINQLNNIPCPTCNIVSKLYGGIALKVVGVLRYTEIRDIEVLACKDCLKSVQHTEFLRTLITGWWSMAGFVHTLRAIRIMLFQSTSSKEEWSEKIIRKFVIKKNVQLDKAYKDPDKISRLIQGYNEQRNFV